jgi:hypothetical protein
MIVQPIVETLAVLLLTSLRDFVSRFAPLAFFSALWLLIKLSTYVRAPIALYRMQNSAFNLSYRLVWPSEPIDDEVHRAVVRGEHALETIGFRFPQRITSAEGSPLSAVESLLEHPGNGDLANVDAMINNHPLATKRFVEWVAFRSVFADGTVLNTANLDRALVGFWPDQAGHQNVILPDVRDLEEVYRLHRSRVARHAASVSQLHESRGSTPEARLAFAERLSLESREFQVSCGYRKKTANGYTLTIRGATLSAWRRLFPWKQAIARQGQRATEEVVRLG